jgi:2-keto-3-deoxy-L-rhamnonate aldolase RhmA
MTNENFETRWREIVSSLRARLSSRKHILGVFVAYPERRLMEFWAKAGFDYAIVDLEHATIELSEADRLIETAINCGIAPIVRAAADDRQALLRCLDAGAAGVMIPDVKTVEEVKSWERTISYPPSGTRGLAQVRANHWDSSRTTDDPRWRPLLVPMIESMNAIDAADDLFALDCADWYHVGLVDLGMRLRANPDGPQAPELLQALCRKAASSGKPLGFNQLQAPADKPPPEGILSIAVPDRVLVLNGAQQYVQGSSK